MAKGAIAAGLRILAQRWGAGREGLERIYLAGAFGNYINRTSARRIGLIDFPAEKVQPAGNTALLGAKLALFNLRENEGHYAHVLRRIEHVPLNEDPAFQDIYADEMGFPESVTWSGPAHPFAACRTRSRRHNPHHQVRQTAELNGRATCATGKVLPPPQLFQETVQETVFHRAEGLCAVFPRL